MPPVPDEVLFASVRELGRRIAKQELSPVDLTAAYLQRLETVGKRLGAVVTILRDQAMAEAEVATKEIQRGRYRGPLHGIPYGAKDLLATRGSPTTWGAAPFRNQRFDQDATIIRKLRSAGAILVAKLAMIELAGGFGYNSANASFTGPCRSPWNLQHWAGGSSSGSGSAVAAGLVAFAIGSETSGSIMCPAAFSGCVGLRPTFGRVSRGGAMALSWSMDKLGPMARTPDDCGLVLATIAGIDPADGATIDKPFAYPEPAREGPPFRIGILKSSDDRVQADVRKNFREAVKLLKSLAKVEEQEIELPRYPYYQAIDKIISSEAASAFRELIESGKCLELTEANDRWGGFAASLTPAVDYLHAMRLRGLIKKAMDERFAPYDAVIAPTFATIANPLDKKFDEVFAEFDTGTLIGAGNLVGQPAVAVPNGFGDGGLPTSITFTGRIWSEARLLTIAQMYQDATGWHRQRPKL